MSTFTPAQSRAARGLLGWSQAQLAQVSKVATKTIADFERESRIPYERTLLDVERAFHAAGVEFTNDGQPGVRISKAGFLLEEISPTSVCVRSFLDGHRYTFLIEDGRILRASAQIGSAQRQQQSSAKTFAINAAKALRFVI